MTKELEEKIEEIEELKRGIKALEETKAGLQKTIRVLNGKVGKQIDEIKLLKEEKKLQDQVSSDKEKEFLKQLENKTKELGSLENKIKDLSKKEKGYEQQIKVLEEKIEKAGDDEEKKRKLQEELEQVRTDLEQVRTDLNGSESQRDTLRKSLSELRGSYLKQRDELNEKIKELNKELVKLSVENTGLTLKLVESQNRVNELERENKKSEANEGSDNNKELQEKNEKLEEKLKKVTRQFLDTKLSDLWSRMTSLISDLNISARDIRQKYGGDYGETLTKEATLENIELLEETLRVIIGICSIERTERISQQIEKQAKPSTATLVSLQENLERNKGNWEQISPNISEENNPLYLPIVGKQDDYRKKTEELINKWENRRSTRSMINLRMVIESDEWDITEVKRYQDLTKTKTIFGVSAAATEKKVDDYFEWLKTEYSSLENEIDQRYKTVEAGLKKCFNKNGISINDAEISKLLHRSLEDSELIEKFKEVAVEKIDKFFGIDRIEAILSFEKVDENEVIRLKDHIQTVLDYGADDIAFLVSCLYEEIYLKYLPRKFEKYLQQDPKVELSELNNDAWGAEKNNLFADFFDKLQNVNRKEDLDLFELNVNKSCRKLMKMIREIKETRVEPDSELCRDPNHSDMPEEAQKKVREHLEKVEKEWKELIKKIGVNSKDIDVLMFKKWYERDKNSEILPFIEEALKSQGELVDYQQLNKEWGEGKINTEGEVEYNDDRDYFGDWSTFRGLLKGWEKAIKNQKSSGKIDEIKELVKQNLGPDYLSLIEVDK